MGEADFYESKRGKWSHPGVPHKGWSCVDIEDLCEQSLTCEMCESQTIRYAHHMQHLDYEKILRVGCVCAGNMEEDLVHARRRDDFMKSRSNKRKTWLTRKWKISSKGNDYIKSDGSIITIFFRNNSWNALIKSEDGSFEKWSRKAYKSKDEVKIASFNYLTKILAEKGTGV